MKTVQAELLQDSLKLYRAMLDQNPGNPTVRYRMAMAQVALGNALKLLGRSTEAAFLEAIAMLDELVKQLPDEPEYQQALGIAYDNLGWSLGGAEN